MILLQVTNICLETMEGHQRAIMGNMTVEQIYRDRITFSKKVFEVDIMIRSSVGKKKEKPSLSKFLRSKECCSFEFSLILPPVVSRCACKCSLELLELILPISRLPQWIFTLLASVSSPTQSRWQSANCRFNPWNIFIFSSFSTTHFLSYR